MNTNNSNNTQNTQNPENTNDPYDIQNPIIITITELIDKRETYGEKSKLNKEHSIRVYEGKGENTEPMEFTLNRTLHDCFPFYSLYYFKANFRQFSIPILLKVDNEEYWEAGVTWEEAEEKAFKRIREFLVLKEAVEMRVK
jgi:hypothetical protein